MKHSFKFEVNEVVTVDGVDCRIVDHEIHHDKPDYLCEPIDPEKMVLGQDELGAGWVCEHLIQKLDRVDRGTA